MAIVLLQTQTASKTLTAGATATASLNSTFDGSLVVVVGNNDNGALSGITSVTCAGMSFTKLDDLVSSPSGGFANVSFWYAWNIARQTTPILTVNFSSGLIGGAIVREYTGLRTTSDPLDKHAIAAAVTASSALNSGATAAQTGNSNLIIGYGGTDDSGNTYTAGAGYSSALTLKVGVTVDLGIESRILSSLSTAQTATFAITNVSNWCCGIATFLPPPPKGVAAFGNDGGYLGVSDGMSRAEATN